MSHAAPDVLREVEALVAGGHHGRALARVTAEIDRDARPDLLVLRARVTLTAAEDPPGDDVRDQLEWLASPAGQQHAAIARERALADLDAALTCRDDVEWRLLRGDVLLDGARWAEAEAAFAAVLSRTAELSPGEAEAAAARAEIGLELARRREDGAADALRALQDVAALMADHGTDSTAMRRVAEASEVIAELARRAEREGAERDPVDERARRVAQSLANVHPDVPERYGPFDPRDLDRRARRFYDRALKALRRQGFELCADVEPLGNTERSGTRTMLRLAVSGDRLTTASIWRLQGEHHACEAIELESALADGSFVRTNDLGTSNPFEQPPQMLQLSLPPGTGAATLVAVHRERLAAASAPAVATPDLAAIAAVQERQRVLKREFARARGWVSDAELRGLLGASYDELAGPVREELTRLLV